MKTPIARWTPKALGILFLFAAAVSTLIAGNFFPPNLQSFGYIAPPAASSTNFSSGNETVYAPYFDDRSGSGDLLAIPVNSDGTPDYLNPLWRAAQKLQVQHWNTGRFIVTTDGAGTAIPFGWDQLTATQRTLLDPATAADTGLIGRTSSPVLNYIRGDRSNEIQNGGIYRERLVVLGDMVHAPPRYVAGAKFGYLFDSYPVFAASQSTRPARVIAGSNDGMLHVFDAQTGAEILAFIPSPVIRNLGSLANPPFVHQYFVDGPLTPADVYFGGGDWRTLIVGGLGAGGQGYFALDITSAEDLASMDESVAASKVLWEYTDSNEPNLGFTYGRPSVVRLQATGQWAVLIPNGYVNTAGDDIGGDGRARLIALDARTGVKLGEIPVSDASDSAGNPNGLSSPTAVDLVGGGDGKVDTVFAGDIKGNLWRFDISGDPSTWADADAVHLFTATESGGRRQAITTAPDVALHPADTLYPGVDVLVYFGTGRLLDNDDFDSPAPTVDTIYAVWSKPASDLEVQTSALVSQTLTESEHSLGIRVRSVTNNPVDWSADEGWKVDLPSGERLLSDLRIRGGRVQFTSVNPMVPSGENWYMSLSTFHGGSPSQVVMDVNGDDLLNANDNVDGNADGDMSDPEDRTVGQYQQFGLASAPLFAIRSGGHDTAVINHLSAINPVEIVESDDPGLRGGHFDLDVSTQSYPLGSGSTDKHSHQWDDKTGLSTIDYMKIPRCQGSVEACLDDPTLYVNDPSFDDLVETMTDPSQQFRIVISNAALSSGGVLQINGSSVPVVTYQQLVQQHLAGGQSLPVYQLGPNPPSGVEQLTSFKLSFSANAIINGGLIGTATGCVRGNEAGPNGEFRNGALTVQVVALDAVLDPTFFYTTSGLLWESTVFWHWKGGCYGSSKWQETYDDCFVAGNICNCVDDREKVAQCSVDDGSGTTDGGSDTGTGDSDTDACTVTYLHPNPRTWEMEFDKPLCEASTVAASEFEMEFDRKVEDGQVTTLTINYDSGSSQSVTFKPTDLFSSRSGNPLQFDLTALEFKDKTVKRMRIRNLGATDIAVSSMTVTWSGGHGSQFLKKIKQVKPFGKDFNASDPKTSGVTVLVPVSIQASGGGAACRYTLNVDYTDSSGSAAQSSHEFDPTLTGISGYPLEIDLDEAYMDGTQKVKGIRIRNVTDSALTITGLSVAWTGATSGQKLKKVRDVTDGSFDVLGSGETSPVSRSGHSIGVGGVTGTTGNCPVDEPPDGDASGGSGGSGGGGSSGDGSGNGGGTDSGPPLPPALRALTGFSITNTTILGGGRTGRLMWRELQR